MHLEVVSVVVSALSFIGYLYRLRLLKVLNYVRTAMQSISAAKKAEAFWQRIQGGVPTETELEQLGELTPDVDPEVLRELERQFSSAVQGYQEFTKLADQWQRDRAEDESYH